MKRASSRLLFTTLLTIATAWLALPYYAPLVLSKLLDYSGYRLLELQIDRPGLSTLEVLSLRLQNQSRTLQIAARSITLQYALTELPQQGVEHIRIKALTIEEQQNRPTAPQSAPQPPVTTLPPLQQLEIDHIHYQRGALQVDGALSATIQGTLINAALSLSLPPDSARPLSIASRWPANQAVEMESQFELQLHSIEQMAATLKLSATATAPSGEPIKLRLNGTLQQNALQQVAATLRLPGGKLELMTGELSSQGYRARMRFHGDNLTQLQQLAMHSALGEGISSLKQLSGAVVVEAEIEGSLNRPHHSLPLKTLKGELSAVGFELYGVKVAGIDYPLHLSADSNRLTLHPNRITIDRIELPAIGDDAPKRIESLTSTLAGTLRSDRKDQRLSIELSESHAALLGGEISIPHGRFPLNSQSQIDIELSGIELTEVTSLLGGESLELQGSLSGHLPLSYREGVYTIHDGHLSADAPGGVIRLRPHHAERLHALAGDTSKVLSNFRYHTLNSRLNFDSGSLRARLQSKIMGHNPEFMEGKAIELNLTIEEQLKIQRNHSEDATY